MKYQVRYHTLIDRKSLQRLPLEDLQIIKKRIEQKLTTEPSLFGKPLRKSLRGYWSLRVGNYRVIYRIEKDTVLIFVIAHRSVVYEQAENIG